MNKKLIKAILISIIISMTFTFEINCFIFPIDLVIFNSYNSILSLLIFLFSFYIFYRKDINTKKVKKVCSLLIAILLLIGEVYGKYHTYSIITTNILTFLISILKIGGYYYLLIMLFYLIDYYLVNINKIRNYKIHNKYVEKFLIVFDKYPFKTSFITIFIFWSIYLIAFYPGVLSPDPYYQLMQYFNVPNKYIDWVIQANPHVFMTTHHPVFHTYLLGFCVSVGRFLINDNFGFFIYTFIQSVFYIGVLSYTISFLKKHQVNRIYRFIILLIYLIVPSYGFYTVSMVKDVFYTGFIILYILFVFDILCDSKKRINTKELIFFIVVMLGACLFRHNGIIIVGITSIVLIFYNKTNRKLLLSGFIIFLGIFFSFNNILVPSLGVSQGSSREMFSVMFQQTARYVKYYGDSIDTNDRKVIDKVLGYNDLKDRYNEELADPVKNCFNKNATEEDLEKYIHVWIKEGITHPGVYIDSFINNTYGYYYPNKHKWYIYANNYKKDEVNKVFSHSFNNLEILRGILVGYGNIFPYIPGIGLFVNIGFNTILLFIMSCYLFSKKNKKYFIVLLPLYLSLLICLLSPANTYFRYSMPYIFIMPALLCLLRDRLIRDK